MPHPSLASNATQRGFPNAPHPSPASNIINSFVFCVWGYEYGFEEKNLGVTPVTPYMYPYHSPYHLTDVPYNPSHMARCTALVARLSDEQELSSSEIGFFLGLPHHHLYWLGILSVNIMFRRRGAYTLSSIKSIKASAILPLGNKQLLLIVGALKNSFPGYVETFIWVILVVIEDLGMLESISNPLTAAKPRMINATGNCGNVSDPNS
ncbi:hypothetical protein DFH94DRAFT_681947 [Russula ochroleuca]|uniref:Uncharacterized protein n=1 Tax=Russula ochroleuca TaxID=152965 RepID=A0A9P5MVV9_9AGAM|nr:hypothetical protein DFH94DRAFT_681947 [Russula ochroleuca]